MIFPLGKFKKKKKNQKKKMDPRYKFLMIVLKPL